VGCDIHMHTFQKTGSNYFCVDGRYIDPWSGELRYRRTFHDRNYMLFACLAGVRNGWGIEPIAEPRGIPEWAKNLSCPEMYDFGDHSQTWLRLDEVMNCKGWSQTVNDERLLDEVQFKIWKKKGPEALTSWCKGASGPLFNSDEEKEFLKSREKWKHIWKVVPVKLEDHEEKFLSMCKYDLAFMAKKWDTPSDIVLVFGFDS